MTEQQNQMEHDDGQEINLLELLDVLVRRKMFIAKVTGLAAVISVAYSLALPNIYSATAKILPPQKEAAGGLSSLIGQAGGGLAGLAAAGLAGGSDLYIGILKSRSVADAVVRRPELADRFKGRTLEQARDELDGAVRIASGKDGIISITASDRDPKCSTLIANTMVSELGKTTVRLNLSKAGTERLFLERRLELVKKELKSAEDELKSYSQNHQIVEVASQAKASIEGIGRLKSELANKEVQLAVLSSKQTDQSPEVRALQSGIKRLKGELATMSGANGGGAGIPSVGEVPGVGMEYSRKLRDFKMQEVVFEQLTKQYELAKINEAKDSSNIQILDEAVVPTQKSQPKRSQIVILATLVALFGSICYVFAREYLDKMPDEDRKIINGIKVRAFSFK